MFTSRERAEVVMRGVLNLGWIREVRRESEKLTMNVNVALVFRFRGMRGNLTQTLLLLLINQFLLSVPHFRTQTWQSKVQLHAAHKQSSTSLWQQIFWFGWGYNSVHQHGVGRLVMQWDEAEKMEQRGEGGVKKDG